MSRVRPIHFPTLVELLMLGANLKHIEISTSLLAERIGKSQQAASKHLLELEREGYVERLKSGKGNSVKLTKKGRDSMFALYSTLRGALKLEPMVLEFRGEVFSGVREGAYYVSQRGYRRQFVTKLGFDPFPGTLNLKLTTDAARRLKQELEHHEGIPIEGFEDQHRSFSRAKCFRATIQENVHGAAILIERTHYDDSVLELLAPFDVRKKLNLEDGDTIEVKVFVSESKSGTRIPSHAKRPSI